MSVPFLERFGPEHLFSDVLHPFDKDFVDLLLVRTQRYCILWGKAVAHFSGNSLKSRKNGLLDDGGWAIVLFIDMLVN